MTTPPTPDVLAVGQAYPRPEMVREPSAGWHPAQGMILVSDQHMTRERAEREWDGARLWLVGSGPLLVLYAQLATGDQLEMPTAWLVGQPRPDWVDHTLQDGERLAVSIVSVDSGTSIVERIHHVTLSPHFSRHLATQAQRRWAEPLESGLELVTAVDAYQRRYPQIKAALRAAVASTRLGE